MVEAIGLGDRTTGIELLDQQTLALPCEAQRRLRSTAQGIDRQFHLRGRFHPNHDGAGIRITGIRLGVVHADGERPINRGPLPQQQQIRRPLLTRRSMAFLQLGRGGKRQHQAQRRDRGRTPKSNSHRSSLQCRLPAWELMANPVIYLDHQATTPCEAAVVEAMAPWWNEWFANPASRGHRPGLQAAAAVEQARQQIAALLGVAAPELVFTHGATEANNLAIKGLAEAELERGGARRHLVTLATEHQAVLAPLRYLSRHGFALTVLPVGRDGLVEPEQLQAALRPDTLLVSVMAANNEIGVLQPLGAIGALCRKHGAYFHCDGAQAVGHMALPLEELGIDLLSFSGHKLYGPKGIGALVVRAGVTLLPQMHGGQQEQGLQAGTLAVPLIVGLAAALQLCCSDQQARNQQLAQLRDRLWQGCQALGDVQRNGAATPRLAHNLNITVNGVDGNALHRTLRRHLAVSSGSACASGSPSHVLQALGLSRQQAAASIRFGLGRRTSPSDIDSACTLLQHCVEQLRHH